MKKENVICGTFRLNLDNPVHAKINNVIMNLDPDIYKSRNQFLIDAALFYIENYGKENIEAAQKSNAEYLKKSDLENVKNELVQEAVKEANHTVIRLLGGIISGMQQTPATRMTFSEKEPEEDHSYENDDVIASCAMGWMMKGEDDA